MGRGGNDGKGKSGMNELNGMFMDGRGGRNVPKMDKKEGTTNVFGPNP